MTSGTNVTATRCEALFASPLQRSDEPTLDEVREAIRLAVHNLGSRGCAAQVAQEFGEHPEIAAARMQWARQVIAETFGQSRLRSSPERRGPRHYASRAA